MFPLGVVLMTSAVLCLGAGFSIDPTFPLPTEGATGDEVAANIHLLFVKQYLIMAGSGALISGSIFLAAAELIKALDTRLGRPAHAISEATEGVEGQESQQPTTGQLSMETPGQDGQAPPPAPAPAEATAAQKPAEGDSNKRPAEPPSSPAGSDTQADAETAPPVSDRAKSDGMPSDGTTTPAPERTKRRKSPPVYTGIVRYRDRYYIRYAKTGEAQYEGKEFPTLAAAKSHIDRLKAHEL